jgi:hypothetical protein
MIPATSGTVESLDSMLSMILVRINFFARYICIARFVPSHVFGSGQIVVMVVTVGDLLLSVNEIQHSCEFPSCWIHVFNSLPQAIERSTGV